MQEIWKSKVNWDEKLRDVEFTRWQTWLRELVSVKTCKISCCYQLKDSQVKRAELQIFCDASMKAHAAVAYWRFSLPDGSFRVALINGRSRVAPLSLTTIPRLELNSRAPFS